LVTVTSSGLFQKLCWGKVKARDSDSPDSTGKTRGGLARESLTPIFFMRRPAACWPLSPCKKFSLPEKKLAAQNKT
jgi:hypothetical protein